MLPWGDAPEDQHTVYRYAVGDTVCSGDCRGAVVSVDAEQATMGVVWSDGDGTIVYPTDAEFLRKVFPWEL